MRTMMPSALLPFLVMACTPGVFEGAWLPPAVDDVVAPEGSAGALRLDATIGGYTVRSDLDRLTFLTTAVGRGEGAAEVLLVPEERVGDGLVAARTGGGVTEWWATAGDALQQGWIVREAPRGDHPLRVDVQVDGGLVQPDDGDGLVIEGDRGGVYAYAGVAAWDANGQPLEASLGPTVEGYAVHVDTDGATFPVTIDPVLSSVGATFTPVGIAQPTAGDVNGDGYDDLVTTAGGSYAVVRYGSSSGPSAGSYTVLTSGSDYRNEVEGGDFNGDGYQDLVVGGWGDIGGEINVHYGSAGGISGSAGVSYTNGTERSYGYCVGVGDFNGDGYDDVAVGGSNTQVDLFYGTAAGLPASPSATIPLLFGNYGYAIEGHGDYNGDGYDDLVVGAAGRRALFYLGGSGGISPAMHPVYIPAPAGSDGFANALSSGDVTGDGRDDLLIGARDSSTAYLYPGAPRGISVTPAWSATGSSPYSYLGLTVAILGDTTGDGYADLALHDSYVPDGGRAYIWDGTAGGVSGSYQTLVGTDHGYSPACSLTQFGNWVTRIGDVNGDGRADLNVGATTATRGDCASGSATTDTVWVYFGG